MQIIREHQPIPQHCFTASEIIKGGQKQSIKLILRDALVLLKYLAALHKAHH